MPHSHRSEMLRRLALCVALLALLLAALAPGRAAAVEPITVRVHFHLNKNDYGGWGLYVWGPGLVLPHSVTWDRSLQPSGVDAYGVYFDVGVEPTVQTFHMIVHRGETKGAQRDMAVDIARQGREVWIREGDDTVYNTPPEIATPYAMGQEVENRERQKWYGVAGGAAAALALLVLGWRIASRRLNNTREQLAATVQMLVQTQGEMRAQGERLQGVVSDELTGLPTRGALQQALEQALARATRQHHHPVAVMFVDLDGFKLVNDTGGHDAGDEVLRTVARRLRASVRESDFIARVGGDEFVVVIEGLTSPMQAFLVGRKLVRAAAEDVPFAGQAYRVGASVGIAMSPDDGCDVAALLKSADTAMYDIKRAGKGACRFAKPQRQAELEHQLGLETALRSALDQEALTLAQEPVVDFASGRVVARKATLRWAHDGQDVPVQPVVEGSDDLDLMQQADRWLLTLACRAAAQEAATEQPPPRVSITLAAAAADMAELPALVRDVLAEAGLPPQRLLLLFPARRLAEPQRSLDVLSRLRGQGVRIGFWGVNQTDIGLQRLVLAPVDHLELDVRADSASQSGTPYVRALAALGAQLGYTVCAIGLDTPPQRRWAEAAGCTVGAGAACAP